MPREISGGKKVVPRTRFLERATAEFSAGRCPTDDILSVCLEGEGTKKNLEAEQFDIIDVITLTFVGHIDPAWNG